MHKFQDSDWRVFCEHLSTWSHVDPTGNLPFRHGLESYLGSLIRKNEEINLTAIRDWREGVWKHLLDSLAITHFNTGNTLDWGTGGGLPGIPLLLWRRHVLGNTEKVFFVDSVGKKLRCVEVFLVEQNFAGGELVFHERGEGLISRLRVDSVLMRAVAPPERAISWFSRAVRDWFIFCGPRNREDWLAHEAQIRRRGFTITEDFGFELPQQLGKRHILRISIR